MEKIKSYTDLEQSRKLAEFLPLESADMYYPNRIDLKYQGALPIEFKRGNPLLSQEIPAWSLAALLNVIPCSYGVYRHSYDDRLTLGFQISNHMEVEADNEVDACVAMILKLHERNLL